MVKHLIFFISNYNKNEYSLLLLRVFFGLIMLINHGINKMKKGKSLDDLDRQIWIRDLSKFLRIWGEKDGAILACSALKESYRKILASKLKSEINWIILYGKYEIILNRVRKRKNHYFKAELLNSQYSQLELPNYGLHYNVELPIKNIAKEIVLRFNNEII